MLQAMRSTLGRSPRSSVCRARSASCFVATVCHRAIERSLHHRTGSSSFRLFITAHRLIVCFISCLALLGYLDVIGETYTYLLSTSRRSVLPLLCPHYPLHAPYPEHITFRPRLRSGFPPRPFHPTSSRPRSMWTVSPHIPFTYVH